MSEQEQLGQEQLEQHEQEQRPAASLDVWKAAAPAVPVERLALWRRILGQGTPADELLAAIAICARYDLDPVLRHVVVAQRPGSEDWFVIVSRDALLHVAHRSGAFDGLEVDDARLEPDPTTMPARDGEPAQQWVARARVWRRDTSHPFEAVGRFPQMQHFRNGGSRPHPYGPEMAVKRAEARALRRAFPIAAGGSVAIESDDWIDGEIDREEERPRGATEQAAARA